ncbi:uncharacterized protein EV154DRAFT_564741 [Mucor mucedo]|uniref:uncharacterized protein n=1 Tax=Mucor mucedo TaxID=29922 RepID=UPI002220B1DA|nr:uncharacterized protein EV154DRAFT_564741 [Mucor mucedo]KAI7890116.1 hypothetical protein EV154DRAFT_564741 [Mucor mucedo]
MQYKFLLFLFIACMVSANAKPIVETRSTLSDNPAEVFQSVSTESPEEQLSENSSEPATEQSSAQSTDPDVEAIIAETEARVNEIINHDVNGKRIIIYCKCQFLETALFEFLA